MYRCTNCNKVIDRVDLFMLPDSQMMVHRRDLDSIYCIWGDLDLCGPIQYIIDRDKPLGIPCS